jgi:hypothetical protein
MESRDLSNDDSKFSSYIDVCQKLGKHQFAGHYVLLMLRIKFFEVSLYKALC